MSRRITFTVIALFSALAITAQINVEAVTQVGRNALYFEDYVLSIRYFNKAIEARPYLAEPYFLRALAKYNLDDVRGAEIDASAAIERNPFIPDAYELRGISRHALGNLAGAISDYRSLLKIMPENKPVLFNLALALEETGDLNGADSTFTHLLTVAPRYDSGYLGRARLMLARGDTVAAMNDTRKALELNDNNINAHTMMAELCRAAGDTASLAEGLRHAERAIRLSPNNPGLYVNRAFFRHQMDDYQGAMDDYDYALSLDPSNYVALYNRALLRQEVADYNRAIADLNRVIALKGTDYRALFNRAIVYKELGYLKEALADADAVVAAFPELAAAYFLRYDIRMAMRDPKADDDRVKSLALAGRPVSRNRYGASVPVPASPAPQPGAQTAESDTPDAAARQSDAADTSTDFFSILSVDEESQDVVASRFTSLLTMQDDADRPMDPGSAKSIRGRVQDRRDNVELQPMFVLSYFTSPTELKPSGDYIKEVAELNGTRAIRFGIQVTNREPVLDDDEDIQRHFRSVEYYNSYIATHTPRAVDFFARGMDLATLRDYEAAMVDFSRAIKLSPDFTLAYLMRAVCRLRALESASDPDAPAPITAPGRPAVSSMQIGLPRDMELRDVLADLDSVVSLSPSMAIAQYNRGIVLSMLDDRRGALNAFSRAIELKPDFGEAFYNRGYMYLLDGDKQRGIADLSHAGELGIVEAYSLLKRMTD